MQHAWELFSRGFFASPIVSFMELEAFQNAIAQMQAFSTALI